MCGQRWSWGYRSASTASGAHSSHRRSSTLGLQQGMCCQVHDHQQRRHSNLDCRNCERDQCQGPALLHPCLLRPPPVSRGHQRTVFLAHQASQRTPTHRRQQVTSWRVQGRSREHILYRVRRTFPLIFGTASGMAFPVHLRTLSRKAISSLVFFISKMTRARATSVPRILSLVALVGLVLNLISPVKSSLSSIPVKLFLCNY